MKVSKHAYAYTPGLKIKEFTIINKIRRLPIPGKVLVKEGDEVNYDTVVAETLVSGDPYVIQAAVKLGITPDALKDCMVKKVGDPVEEGEILAKYIMFFGLIKRYVRSPVKGTVESVSDVTGRIIVRGAPVPVYVDAYIPGRIIKVIPNEGVIIETQGAFIQGIFGIGGEKHGKIDVKVEKPNEVLTADKISSDDRGHILVGGCLATLDAMKKAVEVGAAGIVVGGVESEDLKDFMGTEIGVAITGEEKLGITLIVTEGFGRMVMHKRTFEILKKLNGYMASINGATQIRAGVIRPEVIIPYEGGASQESSKDELAVGMVPGTRVRIIRNPYFGFIGKVVSLPVELQEIETESKVRVLEVELENGQRVIVPRANVEIIEV
ncbi:hypothetical protein DRO56_03925 [Candidatus Bathyarchaeota archaeon]|nr:MAG: hypothetical protein DRO56_03925 [Candidatus Bathyarchaeota archaeon]